MPVARCRADRRRRIRIRDAEAAEELAEGIVGIAPGGAARLGRRAAFGDLDIDHRRAVMIHQCREIRQAGRRSGAASATCGWREGRAVTGGTGRGRQCAGAGRKNQAAAGNDVRT